jgi:hypothetical protein
MLHDKERIFCFFSSVRINQKAIQGVSSMLGQNSGVSFSYTKTKKTVHINTCPPTLQIQPTSSPDLSPLDLYLWGALYRLKCINFKLKMKKTLTTHF